MFLKAIEVDKCCGRAYTGLGLIEEFYSRRNIEGLISPVTEEDRLHLDKAVKYFEKASQLCLGNDLHDAIHWLEKVKAYIKYNNIMT